MGKNQATEGEFPDMMSREDLAGYLERLEGALRRSGMTELLEHMQRLSRAAHLAGLGAQRIPFPLVPDPSEIVLAGIEQLRSFRPQILTTPETFVLNDEVAHAYELADLKVGRNSQFGSADPIPLETFSVKAWAESDRIFTVQSWQGLRTCEPGVTITVYVRRLRPDAPPFRGLLWCRCSP